MQLLPDPPVSVTEVGAIAQLGERLVCNQKVTGSIPVGSTTSLNAVRLPASNVTRLLTRYFDLETSRDQASPRAAFAL